jgi:hypothetical protein
MFCEVGLFLGVFFRLYTSINSWNSFVKNSCILLSFILQVFGHILNFKLLDSPSF